MYWLWYTRWDPLLKSSWYNLLLGTHLLHLASSSSPPIVLHWALTGRNPSAPHRDWLAQTLAIVELMSVRGSSQSAGSSQSSSLGPGRQRDTGKCSCCEGGGFIDLYSTRSSVWNGRILGVSRILKEMRTINNIHVYKELLFSLLFIQHFSYAWSFLR